MARSYFKTEGPLTYEGYVAAIKNGRSYVSDGSAHIIDFSVNGLEAGTERSELRLVKPRRVTVTAKVAAHLSEQQDAEGAQIAQRPLDRQPFWHIERARIGKTRKVRLELIVNGEAVDTLQIAADGNWQDVRFEHTIKQSSWVALRVYPSAHTNPVFVLVDGKPILDRRSAEWCKKAVQQCWKMKQANIRPQERAAAQAAYDQAQGVYRNLLGNPSNK
jgi:hypothetical protein